MADVKWSQFPSVIPSNSDEVVGLHSGGNVLFSIANIVAAVRNGLASIFVPLTRTINGKGLSTNISLDSSDIDYDNTTSGLTAMDVQEAIDELAQGGGGGTTVIANPQGAATATLTKLQVENTIYSVPGGGSGASETMLAYVESGATASKTGGYTAGEYICWQGTLYTANTNIAYGTTFSAATNGNLVECVGGGFNGLFATKTFTRTIARIPQYNFFDGTSDVTVSGYVPIAINTFDIDEDHCIIQKLGFTSNDLNTLYYRIKNYDSAAATNVTFILRVLYARTSLIQL